MSETHEVFRTFKKHQKLTIKNNLQQFKTVLVNITSINRKSDLSIIITMVIKEFQIKELETKQKKIEFHISLLKIHQANRTKHWITKDHI